MKWINNLHEGEHNTRRDHTFFYYCSNVSIGMNVIFVDFIYV